MQISTTQRAAQYTQKTVKAEAGQQDQSPVPGEPPTSQDSFQKSFIDNLAKNPEFSSQLLSQVGSGTSTTISVTDDGIKITNEGPDFMQKVANGGAKLLANASQEVVRVMDADPAFAFKSTAKAAQAGVLDNLDSETKKSLDPFILPVLRTGMLAMDTKRAFSTYRNKDASLAEKIVDIGHVATDVVGLAGAIGQSWVPFLQPYAATMNGIGLAGDIASVTFHAMGYLTERGQVNAEFSGKSGEVVNGIWSSKAANAADERAARAAAKSKEFQS